MRRLVILALVVVVAWSSDLRGTTVSLAANGGVTQPHALLEGSPAIDAGSTTCPPPATDQRGVIRPENLICDIGAYERRPNEALGGVAELPEVATTPLEAAGSSGSSAGVLAGIAAAAAAGVVALGGAAWYARRRWAK